MTPEEFFVECPLGLHVYQRVNSLLAARGEVEVRVTKSQVAFRRRRGFAYLWRPGRYLSRPDADVVLTLALGRRDASRRFKEVVHPSPTQWMHHLEVRDVAEIDDEVTGWLVEAFDRAA